MDPEKSPTVEDPVFEGSVERKLANPLQVQMGDKTLRKMKMLLINRGLVWGLRRDSQQSLRYLKWRVRRVYKEFKKKRVSREDLEKAKKDLKAAQDWKVEADFHWRIVRSIVNELEVEISALLEEYNVCSLNSEFDFEVVYQLGWNLQCDLIVPKKIVKTIEAKSGKTVLVRM